MKPLKTLAFFFTVFALLFLLSVFFPEAGLKIGEGYSLRFVNAATLFHSDSTSSDYVDSLIQSARVTEDPEFGEIDSSLLAIQIARQDSLEKIRLDSLIQVTIDSISERVYPIKYTAAGREELGKFFLRASNAALSGNLLRVIHYGDSQIENDRMTSLIRYRLQTIFGGSGCGMVPAVPLYSGNPVFKESFDGNWKRYTGFGRRDTSLSHNSYGSLTSFTSIPLPGDKKLPSLKFDFMKSKRAAKFNEIKLYAHSYRDSAQIYITLNDTVCDTLFHVQSGYELLSYNPKHEVDKLNLSFNYPEGGRIYGISFDPLAGVQVDNAAMRGSSGLVFSKNDSLVLASMVNSMNTGLFILQFGGNVVPYIQSPSYYQRTFTREIKYLKKLFPDVAILVIGPADMAYKEYGKFVTYPTLEPVRNALKSAALENECCFWDMYEAMGGENSIENFVLADPPLASSDYIHFTPKGANMMAEMFIDALMLEYRKFQTSRQVAAGSPQSSSGNW